MAEGARPDTVRLQRLARAYRESGALLAAVEFGLFTKIARGADTEEKLAAALGLEPPNGERIIIACLGLGLIRREGDKLANAPDVERFLVADSRHYAAPWMFFTSPDWSEWGRLADHLRRSGPPLEENASVANITVEEARRYHEATRAVGAGAGRLFARTTDLSGRARMMDIGGGSGAWSIAACKANPKLRAAVLDLPAVCEVARGYIAEAGLSDRVEAVPCDFNQNGFPADCDLAVMASNLPMYGRRQIARVVKKTHDALLPGGDFHLIGEALAPDRSGPADAALWGLAQTLHASTGLAHSSAEVAGYFEAAGFLDIVVEDFLPGILVRVSGRKG